MLGDSAVSTDNTMPRQIGAVFFEHPPNDPRSCSTCYGRDIAVTCDPALGDAGNHLANTLVRFLIHDCIVPLAVSTGQAQANCRPNCSTIFAALFARQAQHGARCDRLAILVKRSAPLTALTQSDGTLAGLGMLKIAAESYGVD